MSEFSIEKECPVCKSDNPELTENCPVCGWNFLTQKPGDAFPEIYIREDLIAKDVKTTTTTTSGVLALALYNLLGSPLNSLFNIFIGGALSSLVFVISAFFMGFGIIGAIVGFPVLVIGVGIVFAAMAWFNFFLMHQIEKKTGINNSKIFKILGLIGVVINTIVFMRFHLWFPNLACWDWGIFAFRYDFIEIGWAEIVIPILYFIFMGGAVLFHFEAENYCIKCKNHYEMEEIGKYPFYLGKQLIDSLEKEDYAILSTQPSDLEKTAIDFQNYSVKFGYCDHCQQTGFLNVVAYISKEVTENEEKKDIKTDFKLVFSQPINNVEALSALIAMKSNK